MDIATKICSKCGESKPRTDFHCQKGRPDGLTSSCKQCKKTICTDWYLRNAEYSKARNTEYHRANRAKYTENYKRREAEDINFKLSNRLRHRLRSALKNNLKSGSAITNLGCTVEELKVYLAARFLPGMSWENYGKWHVDHIKALANFDLTDIEQLKIVCHYTNLQPLWAEDNIRKSDN